MVFVTSYLSKGVSVMESVASGFYDLPVLMRVPHLRPGNAAACRDIVVILGCGDIVVPGLAVAYCRSYDVMVKKGSRYFLLAIVCYVVTLVVTLLITSHLNTGQPALLYLVPGVLLPVLTLAWWRGDLKKFWQGDLVPPESDTAPRVDAHVSSNEQFQMMQSRGLLYVATPVVSWFAIPLPVSQKDYDAKGN
ncbi:signal peptide peptidase-like 2A [Haemaphysalis longicornis]